MDKQFTVTVYEKYTELVANEGHVLTNWNKENIEDYRYCTHLVCSNKFDYSTYYTITKEESDNIEEEQIKKLKEENNIN